MVIRNSFSFLARDATVFSVRSCSTARLTMTTFHVLLYRCHASEPDAPHIYHILHLHPKPFRSTCVLKAVACNSVEVGPITRYSCSSPTASSSLHSRSCPSYCCVAPRSATRCSSAHHQPGYQFQQSSCAASTSIQCRVRLQKSRAGLSCVL